MSVSKARVRKGECGLESIDPVVKKSLAELLSQSRQKCGYARLSMALTKRRRVLRKHNHKQLPVNFHSWDEEEDDVAPQLPEAIRKIREI